MRKWVEGKGNLFKRKRCGGAAAGTAKHRGQLLARVPLSKWLESPTESPGYTGQHLSPSPEAHPSSESTPSGPASSERSLRQSPHTFPGSLCGNAPTNSQSSPEKQKGRKRVRKAEIKGEKRERETKNEIYFRREEGRGKKERKISIVPYSPHTCTECLILTFQGRMLTKLVFLPCIVTWPYHSVKGGEIVLNYVQAAPLDLWIKRLKETTGQGLLFPLHIPGMIIA